MPLTLLALTSEQRQLLAQATSSRQSSLEHTAATFPNFRATYTSQARALGGVLALLQAAPAATVPATGQHTAEPWHCGQGNGAGHIFSDSGRMRWTDGGTALYPIATVTRGWKEAEDEANERRIVACVNGCAGIADPAAVRPVLHALGEALRAAAAHTELSTGDGVQVQPPAWAIEPNGDFDAQRIANTARAALALLDALLPR